MAVKFYTEEGNWDLTCNSCPVFVINDPIKVLSVSTLADGNPQSNLLDTNAAVDFFTSLPETTAFQIWRQSDAAMPFSYRHMDTFTANTYKLINRHGEPIFARFKLATNQGARGMSRARAVQLAGTSPDYCTQDLVEAIERGDFPSWMLQIQVMTEEQSKQVEFNPFNVTKWWPEKRFPFINVGTITLNRNTANHFDEAEQAVFMPGNFVPGIRAAEGDKNLAGRIFIYQDTQMYRMGVNHNQLQINRPLNPVRNYQREGRGVYVSQGAAPHYFPNSFGGPVESQRAQELDPSFQACDNVARYENLEEDHFSQPREFWMGLARDHQARVVGNFANLAILLQKDVLRRLFGLLEKVDRDLVERIEEAMRQLPDNNNE